MKHLFFKLRLTSTAGKIFRMSAPLTQQKYHEKMVSYTWILACIAFVCIFSSMVLPVHSFLETSTMAGRRQHISRADHSQKISRFVLHLRGKKILTSRRSLMERQQQSLSCLSSPNVSYAADDGYDGLGEYDPSEGIRPEREVVVGDPQVRLKEKERSVTNILKELAAIQQQGPQKYCILGTRHCSYLHQQIIELLAYALVLSGNHVYTSGAGGTHAATIRGALRAEREDLLTVVLPQSMSRQTKESQELLKKVKDIVTMPQNDEMSLDVASRICNSYLLSQTDQLISFAFHESNTVIEATKEAKELDMLVTTLFLD